MKKVLVLGATGMLGHKLLIKFKEHYDVAGTLREAECRFPALDGIKLYTQVDALDLSSIEAVMQDFKPDAIINCIGIIKQLKEAKDSELSIALNSLLPHQLARLCQENQARLIHISTDCVFKGDKGQPYTEKDEADAQDLYGLSKFMGEVKDVPDAITLRTSIIGEELQGKRSLFEWVLSQKGKTVNGFTKALYTGLTTTEIAKVIQMVLDQFPDLYGLYHVSADEISKYDLIALINDTFNLGITLNKENNFYCDRRLNSTLFRKITKYTPPSWEQMIKELKE